jgi:hypothetical protein
MRSRTRYTEPTETVAEAAADLAAEWFTWRTVGSVLNLLIGLLLGLED